VSKIGQLSAYGAFPTDMAHSPDGIRKERRGLQLPGFSIEIAIHIAASGGLLFGQRQGSVF
jgi:hypothetical protein